MLLHDVTVWTDGMYGSVLVVDVSRVRTALTRFKQCALHELVLRLQHLQSQPHEISHLSAKPAASATVLVQLLVQLSLGTNYIELCDGSPPVVLSCIAMR